MALVRLAPADAAAPNGIDPPGERDLDALLAQLVADDPERRRHAVIDLADADGALPALLGRVGVETDRSVREAICTQLARHDVPLVVDSLVAHLASDDAGLRNAVAEVLAKTPRSTAARVPQLLADPDPDVRILTVMVLGTLRLAEVEGWLADLARSDEHPNVVAAAIGELTAIAGDRCEPVLNAVRRRFPDDPFIAFAVNRALSDLDAGRG